MHSLDPIRLRDATADDAAALAHILITATEAAFGGVVPEQCLTFTEAQSAANWARTLTAGLPKGDFMVMVESMSGAAPIGYVWAGPYDADPAFRGVLKQINLLPDVQRKGLGRFLVRYVAERLAAQGIESMRVEVLRVNPNRPFYERLGARFISERQHNWDGVILPMCTYGWTDTRELQGG